MSYAQVSCLEAHQYLHYDMMGHRFPALASTAIRAWTLSSYSIQLTAAAEKFACKPHVLRRPSSATIPGGLVTESRPLREAVGLSLVSALGLGRAASSIQHELPSLPATGSRLLHSSRSF